MYGITTRKSPVHYSCMRIQKCNKTIKITGKQGTAIQFSENVKSGVYCNQWLLGWMNCGNELCSQASSVGVKGSHVRRTEAQSLACSREAQVSRPMLCQSCAETLTVRLKLTWESTLPVLPSLLHQDLALTSIFTLSLQNRSPVRRDS
jgi:hypothetical protein